MVDLTPLLPPGLSIPKLAKLVPCDRTWLNDVIKGHIDPRSGKICRPSWELAELIRRHTRGRIRWEHFIRREITVG